MIDIFIDSNVTADRYLRMRIWCDRNCQYRFFINYNHNFGKYVFAFDSDSDATLFTLTWV